MGLNHQPWPQPRNLELNLPSFSVEKVLYQLLRRIWRNPGLQTNTNTKQSNPKTNYLTSVTTKDPVRENSKPNCQFTSLTVRRRSFSSMTWRSNSSRASASFSNRLLNSIRAKWPVCGGPNTPSGSFLRLNNKSNSKTRPNSSK